MARKKVIDLDCDQTVEFSAPGQQVEGYFIGSKNIETEFGKSKLHVFQGEDGNFGVYGSMKLDEKLATVPAGHLTFITFNGKVKIPGGKTMKKFDVEYDDKLCIDTGNVAVNFTRSEEPEASEPEAESAPEPEAEAEVESADAPDVDDDTVEAGEVDEDAEPKNPIKKPLMKAKPAAAVISSEKKKNTESLLSKTKR